MLEVVINIVVAAFKLYFGIERSFLTNVVVKSASSYITFCWKLQICTVIKTAFGCSRGRKLRLYRFYS